MSYEQRAQKVKAKAATLLGQEMMEQMWAIVTEDNVDLAALDLSGLSA